MKEWSLKHLAPSFLDASLFYLLLLFAHSHTFLFSLAQDFLWHSPLIKEKPKFLGLHKFIVSLQACLAAPVVQNDLPYTTRRLKILLCFIFLLFSDKETIFSIHSHGSKGGFILSPDMEGSQREKNESGKTAETEIFVTHKYLQAPIKGALAEALAFCSIATSKADFSSLLFLPSISLTFGLHFVSSVSWSHCLLEFLEFYWKSLYLMVPSLRGTWATNRQENYILYLKK